MTMDYSPWSEREIWPFLRVPVSPKLERSRPPKSVYMYVTLIPTCMNFLSRFQLNDLLQSVSPTTLTPFISAPPSIGGTDITQ